MYTPLCGTLAAAMTHKLGACITRTRRRSADAFDAFEQVTSGKKKKKKKKHALPRRGFSREERSAELIIIDDD